MATAPSASWTDSVLQSCRSQADPIGDGLVSAALSGDSGTSITRLMLDLRALVHTASVLKDENSELPADPSQSISPEMRAFVENAQLPDWADPTMIEETERIYMRYGFAATLSLLGASLPECYTLSRGAQALHRTHELERRRFLRLFETCAFLVDVMSPKGLTAAGHGLQCAREVRLLHCTVRHYLQSGPQEGDPPDRVLVMLRDGRWDTEFLGKPINQEDMAFTILTFSYINLRTFEIIGIRLTQQQQEAYLHAWNVIGAVMGLDRSLMAFTMAEAEELYRKVRDRNIDWTGEVVDPANGIKLVKASRDLTKALTEFVEEVRPRWLPSGAAYLLIRTFVDKDTADILAVPELTLGQKLLKGLGLPVVRLVNWVRSALPEGSMLSRITEAIFVDTLVKFWDGESAQILQDEESLEDTHTYWLTTQPTNVQGLAGSSAHQLTARGPDGVERSRQVGYRAALSFLVQKGLRGQKVHHGRPDGVRSPKESASAASA